MINLKGTDSEATSGTTESGQTPRSILRTVQLPDTERPTSAGRVQISPQTTWITDTKDLTDDDLR